MTVFHGSDTIVKNPDVLHSFRNLDFGKGFYVTSIEEQAERWAKRKADFSKLKAVLNIYELKEDFSDLKVLDFKDDLDTWIDFVCSCRNGNLEYTKYDLIIGKVANDKVFRVVDMYNSGIWEKERAIKEIKAYKNYDQIAFITQKAIDNLLFFTDSREL